MTPTMWTYLIFGIVIVLALVFDLGLLSKKSTTVSIKKALVQTCFWVILSLAFFGFIWFEDGHEMAIRYLSAYLMEWSLSIDNIFVFILIFGFFKIKETSYARVLLIGILMAIVFRAIFITIGAALIERFHWILYVFGVFLVYTGIKMFSANQEEEFKPEENIAYRLMSRYLNITDDFPQGRFIVKRDKKTFFTPLAIVVVMLAVTDVLFALDSIPAVFAISQEPLVVYTSNIFAVLGLRSLFFLLRGAVDEFEFLQHGIAIVLVFIGLKMLAEIVNIHMPVYVSLIVIVCCLGGAILYSVYHKRKKAVPENTGSEK
ncbi:MAG TPA: TerC/Alx family metal homeostasis membrane protein [Chitinophaga sp.]|uniref:TerC/Alx family metal homeostasis membrane protein n=1 Tax=Chitinophaga sp. TaxID=1869181 RepID=UPI002DBDD364|nr:TerC/Alx family metal homeostasis membrane protein [Chitinophaga sp.]HEU4553315.1 TerC/Alx family metal homeostasis membrane protein [Chitinophaga sp.]